jgi:hypothetical protein
MAQLPEGLTILYQGKVCGPVFELTRPVGLEPGHGSVWIGFDQFEEDFKIDEGLEGVDLAPAGVEKTPPENIFAEPHHSTRDAEQQQKMSADKQRFGEAVRGWQSCGDLVFAEVRIDGSERTEHVVTFQKMCLAQRAVESPFSEAEDLCKVEITDLRAFWGERGTISAWINVPTNAPGSPVEGTSPLASSTGTQEVNATGGGIGTFIPGSTIGGVPWTLRETLERFVLPFTPGNPKINRLPRELETATPIGHVWNAEKPKKVIGDLLAQFDLELSLDFDSNISFWKKGEGRRNPASSKSSSPRPAVARSAASR